MKQKTCIGKSEKEGLHTLLAAPPLKEDARIAAAMFQYVNQRLVRDLLICHPELKDANPSTRSQRVVYLTRNSVTGLLKWMGMDKLASVKKSLSTPQAIQNLYFHLKSWQEGIDETTPIETWLDIAQIIRSSEQHKQLSEGFWHYR